MWRWLAGAAVLAILAGCGNNLGKIDKGTVPIANPPTNVTAQKGVTPTPPANSGGSAPSKGPVKPGVTKK